MVADHYAKKSPTRRITRLVDLLKKFSKKFHSLYLYFVEVGIQVSQTIPFSLTETTVPTFRFILPHIIRFVVENFGRTGKKKSSKCKRLRFLGF